MTYLFTIKSLLITIPIVCLNGSNIDMLSKVEAEMVFIVAISTHPPTQPPGKVSKWPLTANHQKGELLLCINTYQTDFAPTDWPQIRNPGPKNHNAVVKGGPYIYVTPL